MKTTLTLRRILGISAIGLGCTLVILSLATLVAADGGGTPTVNGLFYGDGDENNYYFLGENPGRGKLYYNREGNTLYLAVVVDDSVNDNVFGDTGDADDTVYLKSAGWKGVGNKHQAKHLITSDNTEFKLQCGDYTYDWFHDYLYDADGDEDPGEADWLSGPGDGSIGGGTPPPGLVSASSLQYNMNNSTWDVTLAGSRSGSDKWKSVDGDSDNDVTDEGWPTYNSTYDWEWAMVYEMSIDVSVCGNNAITVSVPSAHNSPSKDGTDDVPICPDGCVLQGIGDYVWWDEDGEGDQDEDPPTGLDDVIVELYSGSCPPTGDPIATDTTSGGGYYYFGSLEAGDYCVKLADSNFESGGALYNYRSLTDQNAAGVPDDKDSDFDPTNHTVSVTLIAGAGDDLTIDAGVEYTDPPTVITLSSFAAKSSTGGWASLWLGLVGLMVLAAGTLFWAKRRAG